MSFNVQPAGPARPNRCQLFGPGSRPELFEKMAASAADVVNLDLEDSVAPADKEEARRNIIKAVNEIDWGTKTLSVRMDRHNENAARVVELLQASDKVTSVLYPGLPDHPGHAAAARQMRGFGGMVSFRVGSRDAAVRVTEATELFTLAESLGAVESLIEHPGAMTHLSAAGSPLEVPDDLVRLSVGIEDADDFLADLDQALGQL